MAEYNEGDVVEVDVDGSPERGLVTGVFEQSVEWPTGDGEDETIEGTPENPVYIISLVSGGTRAFREDELVESEFPGEDMDDEEVTQDLQDAEEASIYERMDDVEDLEDFRETRENIVRAENITELSTTPGTSKMGYDELIDIPGVDDPGVGWDSYPDSWRKSEQPNRLILLKAWAAMGATWRGCFREMSTNMTPRRARRLCSSMKDEVYGTEEWRGFA